MNKEDGLKKLTNGYYIATALKPAYELKTREKDYLAAGTVNWVSQLAFEPLLVGVSVEVDGHLNETIDYSGKFTLHILSDKQMGMIENFGQSSTIIANTINGIPYRKENDELILEDTIGFITCKLKESVRCGDHTLHIGEVVRSEVKEDLAPLSTVAVPSSYKGAGA